MLHVLHGHGRPDGRADARAAGRTGRRTAWVGGRAGGRAGGLCGTYVVVEAKACGNDTYEVRLKQ
jgi:hypothetical protein